MKQRHDRIEAIAGAIALGEASDAERLEYREHLTQCASCLRALGGEHEIERVAAAVGQARDAEIWKPEIRWDARMRARRHLRNAGFAAASALLISAAIPGAHALLQQASPPRAVAAAPVQKFKASPPAQRRLIVEHNVVQIARAPVQLPPVPASSAPIAVQPPVSVRPSVVKTAAPIAAITVHPAAPLPARHTGTHSNVPIWRRVQGWQTVAKTTTTSLTETAPQSLTHSAESMQLAVPHTMRDAVPVGGATAINPQPPMIAYDEGAEGTSVFEVLVDERGNPTRCVITKSAGYTVLDGAVCKAAMQVHYLPKEIDGRPVPGVYRDAFTFRMSDD